QVSGYTANEIARMHLTDFFGEADKAQLTVKGAEVATGASATLEAAFVTKDGRALPYSFIAQNAELDGTSGVVCIGIDMTARIEAENVRKLSEERYRRLFECAPDGILLADPDGTYLDANPAICRMLGFTREELIGRNANDIVVPAEQEHIVPALREINAGTDYHREWIFRRKDGSTFAADVIGALTPDGYIMGMIRDISERKRAELALSELNESLEQRIATRTDELRSALIQAESAERAKSAFLATMSHELRTPLNSILGFTGLVLMGLAGPLTAEQTRQLGMVKDSAARLLELINDVLDLSKIEAGQFATRVEPFDLRALVERAVESVRPAAEMKGITLTATVAAGIGELRSDRRRVEQILINLLGNAIKFTESGGVTVTAEPWAPSADGQPQPDRSGARIAVADTGIGIKPEALGLLFKPFQQIDDTMSRRNEGTGLGLAISQRLAHLLGGEIGVSSEWGRGSRFTVYLPSQSASGPA
ncbi:MAG: PAS domain-containing sensor histidine kinase, partial [Rudaea sp.]